MTADFFPTDVLPPGDAEKVARANVQRGLRAVAQVRSAFEALGAADKPEVVALLEKLEGELDALRPPDPRKCKEYLRAVSRERKGLIGIRPEDVVRYCRCPECTLLRMKMGLEHPSGPTAEELEPADPSDLGEAVPPSDLRETPEPRSEAV